MVLRPARSTLFLYTTLFRSLVRRAAAMPKPAPARQSPPPSQSPSLDVSTDAGIRPVGGCPLGIHGCFGPPGTDGDRKSTRLNSSHGYNSHAVFCLKKKKSLS